jgi:hypothetical protein
VRIILALSVLILSLARGPSAIAAEALVDAA